MFIFDKISDITCAGSMQLQLFEIQPYTDPDRIKAKLAELPLSGLTQLRTLPCEHNPLSQHALLYLPLYFCIGTVALYHLYNAEELDGDKQIAAILSCVMCHVPCVFVYVTYMTFSYWQSR